MTRELRAAATSVIEPARYSRGLAFDSTVRAMHKGVVVAGLGLVAIAAGIAFASGVAGGIIAAIGAIVTGVGAGTGGKKVVA